MNIADFPKEIILCIFLSEKFSLRDIVSIHSTCKVFNNVLKSNKKAIVENNRQRFTVLNTVLGVYRFLSHIKTKADPLVCVIDPRDNNACFMAMGQISSQTAEVPQDEEDKKHFSPVADSDTDSESVSPSDSDDCEKEDSLWSIPETLSEEKIRKEFSRYYENGSEMMTQKVFTFSRKKGTVATWVLDPLFETELFVLGKQNIYFGLKKLLDDGCMFARRVIITKSHPGMFRPWRRYSKVKGWKTEVEFPFVPSPRSRGHPVCYELDWSIIEPEEDDESYIFHPYYEDKRDKPEDIHVDPPLDYWPEKRYLTSEDENEKAKRPRFKL
jgi:hypothetical protein